MNCNLTELYNILSQEFKPAEVDVYCGYCDKLAKEKKRDKTLKNPWMQYRTNDELIRYFKKVKADLMTIDGEHITLNSYGVSYDYIAYKNKMFIIYPETVFDYNLVYKGDKANFKKVSGKVQYLHDIADPFSRLEKDIIGGYCIIKNKRGEFLTTLSNKEIEKHRAVAKTDGIWKAWFAEMCLKTVVKKACSTHFKDQFQNIENLDNVNYDLENVIDLPLKLKQDLESINTVEGLEAYYHKNVIEYGEITEIFIDSLAKKKEIILEAEKGPGGENGNS